MRTTEQTGRQTMLAKSSQDLGVSHAAPELPNPAQGIMIHRCSLSRMGNATSYQVDGEGVKAATIARSVVIGDLLNTMHQFHDTYHQQAEW